MAHLKRHLRYLVLVLAPLLASMLTPLVVNAADKVLSLPITTQQFSNWCWAASAKAVMDYNGMAVQQQCELANSAFGRTECCAGSAFWETSICNHGNYLSGPNNGYDVPGMSVETLLNRNSQLYSFPDLPLSQIDAVAEIDRGFPFIMEFQWKTAPGAHAVVAHGYDLGGEYIVYMDPWPGIGYQRMPYNSVLDASDHTWTISLRTTHNATLGFANFGTGGGTIANLSPAVPTASCSSPCTTYFPLGTTVALTATPDGDSYFAGWGEGACSGVGTSTCTYTIQDNSRLAWGIAILNILPPVADFSATPTSGVGTATVSFTNNSRRDKSRLWDFGDGTFSTEYSPTHTYSLPGAYTVSLRATNSSGDKTITKAEYVLVSAVNGKPADCDGNSVVSIAEVQSAINMYLGMKPIARCVDADNSGSVSIAEVQRSINTFLGM